MNMMIVGNGSSNPTSHSSGVPLPVSASNPTRPPPAHVTQLTSSPTLGQAPHVVQHHPPPAPQARDQSYPSRPVPMSPQRPSSSSRVRSNSRMQLPHFSATNLPLMTPSPAHQLLPSSVNSPSLIPQNIPQSFLPQLPLHISPAPRSPQLRAGSPLPSDNVILPPHAFKKLTRPLVGAEDDVEVHDSPPNVGRRNLVSPRQRERRNLFSHVALQDHNYCAVPPPSPPRSPTPPLSPYLLPVNMGAQPAPSQEPQVNDQQSFSFGIAGYKAAGPSIGAYPSPHYSGPQVQTQSSPLSRLKQTIEEAGVGPMTPLGEEGSPLSADKSHESRPSPDRDGGEETETAPEAEDEGGDDAITRCVCEFQHDDGFMICCDKCSVWQHVVCMVLDKNNIPDEYLCEKCHPRIVDKKRAKALQRAREKEIFKALNLDSSDDEKKPPGGILKGRKSGIRKGLGLKRPGVVEKRPEKKITKKPGKRRSFKLETSPVVKPEPGLVQKKPSPRKNQRRKSASATDIDTEEENPNDAMALRSWIDTYEEAVTNHYSPELRARLQGAKLPTNQFKPKEVNGIRERCNVSLRGNGMKVLTANSYIPANTPIIECRGKYMLSSQLIGRGRATEYALFHRITSDLEVCVDSKTYGNDSRFCRRAESKAMEYNAEVKHHLDKGSLHLYIVSTKAIEKNQEIFLSPENKNGILPPLSIQDELRQIKKMNGLTDEKKSRKNANAKRRLKRECVKKDLCDSSSEDDTPVSLRKTRSNAVVVEKPPEKNVNFDLKLKEEAKVPKEEIKEEPTPTVEKEKIDVDEYKEKNSPTVEMDSLDAKPDKMKELKIEIKEETVEVPTTGEEKKVMEDVDHSPTLKSPDGSSSSAPAKSPGKPVLGLPDQSGLIVGVNTINYDVGLRNKSKTREEKKMEMILKAIEAMERAEARKKSENGESGSEKVMVKRRRSNSMKKDNADSNLDGSSGDEGGLMDLKSDRAKVTKGKRRRNLSMRRRSRAKSGDSTSAMSADEGGATPNLDSESAATPGDHQQPFKFPFKKQHAHDNFNADSEDVDDDVSGHYIRGSRSPPGIANHLLRSAVTNHAGLKSPTKTIGCSAKKRWLRAAMSEDHSEEVLGAGLAGSSPGQSGAVASPGQSGGSPEPDYTPLKKRRLATYNESTEENVKGTETALQDDRSRQAQVTEKIKSLPNGLKKRLISNLLLDAVLDKAMQDILPIEPDMKEEETEKENKEEPVDKSSHDSPLKKKPKSVKKGKGKKSGERVEVNGVDDGAGSKADETEAKISSEAGGVKVARDDSRATSEPTISDTPEIKLDSHKDDKDANTKPESDKNIVNSAQSLRLHELEDKPPTPVQHSVFKSFFSTDLTFDDIDRQIEAKRVELARESSVSSVQSPLLESLNDEPPRTPQLHTTEPWSKPVSETPETPGTTFTPAPKKRVTIADYKKRKQVGRTDSVDEGSEKPLASILSTPSILSTLSPITTLPELPGLESRRVNTASPIFDIKRTRSNSPLSDRRTRSSPQILENKTRSGSPQLDFKTRAGSPLKAREKVGSPRKPGSALPRYEKWEAKSKESSGKVRPQLSSNNVKRTREPVPTPKAAPAPAPSPAPAPVYVPRPHIPTPDEPREDLTERLRKEFGLNIEDSDGDGSDSESSGAPSTEREFPTRSRTSAVPSSEKTGWSEDCGGYWNRDNIRREPPQRNSQL